MENQKYEDVEIDIRELISILLRKIWIIIIATVFTIVVVFLYSKFSITPQYESTTKIYLITKNEDSNRITTSDLQLGSQLSNDYIALVKSRPVLEEVISELNLDINFKSFAEKISVSNPDSTRIVEIKVRYSNPQTAKLIADNVRDISADHIKGIMDLEEVKVVEEGNLPQGKISPNELRNSLIGGMLGCMISIFGILFIYSLDDTIKTPDDIDRYLGLSVLGSIPLQEDERTSNIKKKRFNFITSKKKKITRVRRK